MTEPFVGPIRSTLALTFVAFGGVVVSCTVDDTLDDRLWRCNADAASTDCGTKDGRPMACWQGYCMSSCDPNEPVPNGKICLEDGVLLDTCSPLEDACPGDLNCYRTDLLNDDGVCVPFRTCDSHDDCSQGIRDNCAGLVLKEYIGEDVSFFSDHFQCVAKRCGAGMMDCPAGERCLDETYRVAGRYPDICLPSCEHDEACMPNFACMQSEAAPGADPICVPGVPGVRCTSDLDCLVGKCADLRVGFGICTIECDDDDDCTILEREPLYFVCAGEGDGPKYCVNPTPFGGANCNIDDPHCPEETPDCLLYSPWGVAQSGECRRPCDGNGRCSPRGGLGHVCLGEDGEGGCYPGVFGIPCKDHDECVKPLRCLPVTPDGREIVVSDHICSFECDQDSDCHAKNETGGTGYCAERVCRVQGLPGSPCERAEHCRSNQCDMGGTCAP